MYVHKLFLIWKRLYFVYTVQLLDVRWCAESVVELAWPIRQKSFPDS